MQKKLIGFDEELIKQIEDYSGDKTFTEAVRSLVVLGLESIIPPEQEQEQGDAIDLITRVKNLEEKVNILVSVSKNFKGHLDNREIHLQD